MSFHSSPPSPPVSLSPSRDETITAGHDVSRPGLSGDSHINPTVLRCFSFPVADRSGRHKMPRRNEKRKNLFKKFNPQLILENSGSVARDHLASERTYLAYVRTSLTIASVGVALVQLLTLSVDASSNGSLAVATSPQSIRLYARALGATMVIFSLVVLILGLIRYFTIQHALTLNQFPAARTLVLTISIILGVFSIVIFAILVTRTRS